MSPHLQTAYKRSRQKPLLLSYQGRPYKSGLHRCCQTPRHLPRFRLSVPTASRSGKGFPPGSSKSHSGSLPLPPPRPSSSPYLPKTPSQPPRQTPRSYNAHTNTVRTTVQTLLLLPYLQHPPYRFPSADHRTLPPSMSPYRKIRQTHLTAPYFPLLSLSQERPLPQAMPQ